MNLIYIELVRLVDDYYRCENDAFKQEILYDIQLLTKAVCLTE
ncbi:MULTISPECIES: hypothetical protein [unclassified Psychrobacillus]|nr:MULTISPECIES: hypothetical protein [unclassified Psychrobacillus]